MLNDGINRRVDHGLSRKYRCEKSESRSRNTSDLSLAAKYGSHETSCWPKKFVPHPAPAVLRISSIRLSVSLTGVFFMTLSDDPYELDSQTTEQRSRAR